MLWKTKEGQRLRICDMKDSHLLNSIILLYRFTLAKMYETKKFYMGTPGPTADMAMMAFEQEFDHVMESTWEDYVPDKFNNLIKEAHRRGMSLPTPLDTYYPDMEER
jgi:hypothetical protein